MAILVLCTLLPCGTEKDKGKEGKVRLVCLCAAHGLFLLSSEDFLSFGGFIYIYARVVVFVVCYLVCFGWFDFFQVQETVLKSDFLGF